MRKLLLLTVLFLALSAGALAQCTAPEVRAAKAEFARLTPAQKSLVWRIHFDKALRSESLTQAQRVLINNIGRLTMRFEIFDVRNTSQRAELQRIGDDALSQFSKTQAQQLFSTLTKSDFEDAGIVTTSFDDPIVIEGGNCTCNIGGNSYCCLSGQPCHTDGSSSPCAHTADGCGFLWIWSCNGVCGGCAG